MSRFEVINANPMLELAKKHAPLNKEDKLPFSCRGCGNYCCGDLKTPIHVLPPEYIRIQWYLQRNPGAQAALPDIPCFIYDYEHVSGLPVLKLNFHVLLWLGYNLHACPFLAMQEEGDSSMMLTCLIHPARPHTCRIFPVGMTMEGSQIRNGITTSYYMMSYCPGFEMPPPDEKTLPGYEPPSMSQTVEDWLDRQMDKDQYEEMLYHFFDVMSYYYHQGWHLSMPGSPGSFTPAMYQELSKVFYYVPDPPEHEKEDHEQIMKILEGFKMQASTIIRSLDKPSTLSLF